MYGTSDSHFFDRSFLLTGATRGLGPDLAHALAARGARIIAVDDCPPALDRLAGGINLVTTLAGDFSHPLTALEIARWIAAEHRDFGGMICNVAPDRARPALHPQVIAPLSVIGHLDRLLPARRGSAVGLVVPSRPLGRDLARLAGTLRDFNWNGDGRLRLTMALLEGGIDGRKSRISADAVLDALACDRKVLRLRPGAARWWRRAALAPPAPGKPITG